MGTLTLLIYLWSSNVPVQYVLQVDECTNEIREAVLETYRPVNYKMIVTSCVANED